MEDLEEQKISADMDEIISNIDAIIDKLNHQDPGKTEEIPQTENLK